MACLHGGQGNRTTTTGDEEVAPEVERETVVVEGHRVVPQADHEDRVLALGQFVESLRQLAHGSLDVGSGARAEHHQVAPGGVGGAVELLLLVPQITSGDLRVDSNEPAVKGQRGHCLMCSRQ